MEKINENAEVNEEVIVEEENTKFAWLKTTLIAVGGIAVGVIAKTLFDNVGGDDEDEEEESEPIMVQLVSDEVEEDDEEDVDLVKNEIE